MIILNIIIKDLKTILSDRKALAIILFMPIILMTILSFALKGSFSSGNESSIEKVNIAVVKQYDENSDSQMFISTLNNSFIKNSMGEETKDELLDSSDEVNPEKIFFKDFLDSKEVSEILSYSVEAESNALKLLDDGKVSAVVLLPEKYMFDMKMNLLTPFRNKVDIKILTHPDRNIDGQIVASVVEAYSNVMSTAIIGKNVVIEAALSNNIEAGVLKNMNEVMTDMQESIKNINIEIDDVKVNGRKQINSSAYYAVAMISMFILYAASHGGRMLLEEKENITMQRMIIAGVSRFKILAGKFFTIFLIAVIQIMFMIIFSHLALKVQWGNTNLVLTVSLISSFAVAGIGVFIAVLTYKSNNYKMANIFESAIIQMMALIGGSFIPIDVMPKIIQKLSFLSVNGIVLKAYLKIMMGFNMADIINYIAALIGIGVIFILLSFVMLGNKEEIKNDIHNKIKTAKA